MGGGLLDGGEKMSSRFSNVIPNTSYWFRNLNKYAKQITSSTTKKDTNKTSPLSSSSSSSSQLTANSAQPPPPPPKLLNQPRKSYHFTRDLTQSLPAIQKIPRKDIVLEPPRKSLRRRSIKKINHRPLPKKPLLSSSSSSSSPSLVSAANCTCRTNSPDFTQTSSSSDQLDSMLKEYGSTPDTVDNTCKCSRVGTKNAQFHPEHLPPIVTKNSRHHAITGEINSSTMSVKQDLAPTRRLSTTTPSGGFKLRTNSPRIVSRRINYQGGKKSELAATRRSVYESFAVVKSSKDPRRDFRESMVEMIVENNIMESSKDLEELLACYLSLNSHHYHDTIINVFKQIWVEYLHL